MKTRFLIITGMLVAVIAVTGLSLMNNIRYTENPNECWIQDDDGEIKPCVIETGGLPTIFSPWPEQNCDEICQESNIMHTEMSGMSQISYGHQWILAIVLMIAVLVAIAVGIIFGIKIWRNRK